MQIDATVRYGGCAPEAMRANEPPLSSRLEGTAAASLTF